MPTLKRRNRKELLTKTSTHCRECGVRACSIFKDCSSETLDKISGAKRSFVYLKGQRILVEGTDERGIYFVHSGKVKMYKTGKNGRHLIIHFAKSGEAFGLRDMDADSEQPLSTMALEDTRLCYIEKNVFITILRSNPEIAIRLLKYFKELLAQSEEQSIKMARLNVPSKIADGLCTIYQAFGTDATDRYLNLALSRQDMADLTGTTKEQVSKTIADFKIQGIIQTKGKQIVILDLTTLQKMSKG